MRRLLRDVAEDQALGDTTTLADPSVVEGIKARYLAAATGDDEGRAWPTGYVPEHWTWHDGPVDAGPAAVVDIDGVLSDAASRQHYLEAPRRDWNAFFEACGDDPVIEEVKVLLDLLDPELRVVLLTARPERVHHLTEAWLRRYRIRWDVLLMRPWGDYEMARDFKQASVWDLRELRLRAAARDRGRPPQRGDVPRRGRALRLLPLRLLRLNGSRCERESRERTDAPHSVSRVSGPTRARRGGQTMKNALKTAVLLAALGGLFMVVGGADRRAAPGSDRARPRPRRSSAAPTGSATRSRSRPPGRCP